MTDRIEKISGDVVTKVAAGVREAGRRLRSPGAVFGPPLPAANVPDAPSRPAYPSLGEAAARLPRAAGVVSAQRVSGALAPRGWTGEMFRLGDEDAPLAFVRRLPAAVSKAALAGAIFLTVVGHPDAGSDEDRRVVELLDLDGHVLLRSTFGWKRRRGGGWTMRSVTLADGTPVAEIVRRTRRGTQRDVVPAVSLQTLEVSTDWQDLVAGWRAEGRVWRGARELARASRQGGSRSVTLDDLTSDDEALLVWSAALSWWGGGTD